MCTLSFIKIGGQQIITANRDENPGRASSELSEYNSRSGEKFLISKDPVAGGTNIALGESGRVSVLLNGAFERHPWGKEYIKSRGIILLETLEFDSLEHFTALNDLERIEPFTLVNFTNSDIEELRWDGSSAHHQNYSISEPKIWASAQLYDPQVRLRRDQLFSQLLETRDLKPSDVLNFHFNAGDGDKENDLVMNRSGMVQTVSITQSLRVAGIQDIKHFDLINDREYRHSLN